MCVCGLVCDLAVSGAIFVLTQVFLSKAHFYECDESVVNGITGMSPAIVDLHDATLDIEPVRRRSRSILFSWWRILRRVHSRFEVVVSLSAVSVFVCVCVLGTTPPPP